MNIHIVCRNWQADRILPRFARYSMEAHGWTVGAQYDNSATANYLMAYFEYSKIVSQIANTRPLVAYMTHLEEGDNAKARLYNQVAGAVALRVAMNRGQVEHLNTFGPTTVLPLPVETQNFTPRPHAVGKVPIIGLSGYTYASGRKGEALVTALRGLQGVALKASGRGWPGITTKMYQWREMPDFYRSLDLFVCTSLVEGGPLTTLEALSCGVPVVIPSGVGIHDEIPDVPGIYRYPRGNAAALVETVKQALGELGAHNAADLRAAVEPHSVEAWTTANADMMAMLVEQEHPQPAVKSPKAWPAGSGQRGIYVVAFGDPSRTEAKLLIDSAHKYLPGVPVALCSDRAIGNEDVLIAKPDADIGGRIAKLSVYDYAPQEWEYILYLDADTEIVSPDPVFFFDLLRDGWEFVICKDAHLHDTLKDFERRNNFQELQQTIQFVGTGETLQVNGGVWSFRRNPNTKRFFELWLKEWGIYKGRDQGALLRALHTQPLRTFWLGSEWNTLLTLKGQEYPPGRAGSAGILHHVGRARRWEGQVPAGKGLTDPEAWAMVQRWEQKYGKGK